MEFNTFDQILLVKTVDVISSNIAPLGVNPWLHF